MNCCGVTSPSLNMNAHESVSESHTNNPASSFVCKIFSTMVIPAKGVSFCSAFVTVKRQALLMHKPRAFKPV